MKLPIFCSQCMVDDVTSVKPIAVVEFRDDGRYELTCPKGHKSVTILQQQKFEILYDIGAYAIVDGYYREAVSSFASSLEQYYAFFIKAVLLNGGIGEDDLREAWKSVTKQSERQLGAFIILYTSVFGYAPLLMSNNNVEFRNDVIHRGKIPTRNQAVEYGQAILDVVRPTLRKLKEKFSDGIQKTVFHHLKSCRLSDDNMLPISTMGLSTILSLTGDSDKPLDKALSELIRWSLSI